MSDYFSRSGAAQRDDISPTPGSTAPEFAIGEPVPPAGAYGSSSPDLLAEEALRWSMAALLFQCTAILILIVAWIPGVEWFFSACSPPGEGRGLVCARAGARPWRLGARARALQCAPRAFARRPPPPPASSPPHPHATLF
jgi:hypothetical protein